jgi:hypothetical protein
MAVLGPHSASESKVVAQGKEFEGVSARWIQLQILVILDFWL